MNNLESKKNVEFALGSSTTAVYKPSNKPYDSKLNIVNPLTEY